MIAKEVHELQKVLLEIGLWVKPLSDWVQDEGLETIDDLRFYFDGREAADRAGPMVGLAWSRCGEVTAADRSMEVLRSRRSSAEEAASMGRILTRPTLAKPRRAQRPRQQPAAIGQKARAQDYLLRNLFVLP